MQCGTSTFLWGSACPVLKSSFCAFLWGSACAVLDGGVCAVLCKFILSLGVVYVFLSFGTVCDVHVGLFVLSLRLVVVMSLEVVFGK